MKGIKSLSRSFSNAANAGPCWPNPDFAVMSFDARPLGITTIIGTAFLSAIRLSRITLGAPPRGHSFSSPPIPLCPLWNVCRFSATNGWGNSSPLVREIAARFESAADGHTSHRSIRTYLASRHFASGRRRFEQLRLDRFRHRRLQMRPEQQPLRLCDRRPRLPD